MSASDCGARRVYVGAFLGALLFFSAIVDAIAAHPTPPPGTTTVEDTVADDSLWYYDPDADASTPWLAKIYDEVHEARRFQCLMGGAIFGLLLMEYLFRYLTR